MNSDFQEAFEERCPHIQPVFDYFHIVKNFNEKFIGAIRKDEQRRLAAEGNTRAAVALKKTKYILTSSKDTLRRKDEEAAEGKVLSRGEELFLQPVVVRKSGYVQRYEELIPENQLFFTLDICAVTQNKHLLWFRRILDEHFEGIIAHAIFNISAGRIEGINNKIKTLRRKGYGYPDDDYFFLKLFDVSRKPYIRNPSSHIFYD